MIRTLSQGAFLLCMAALIGAGTVSAQAVGTSVPVLAGRLTDSTAVTSTTTILAEKTICQVLRLTWRAFDGMQSRRARLDIPASLLPIIWPIPTSTEDRNNNDNEMDRDKDDRAPDPAPEPPTILSFGAALVIGAGVIYLRRLRGERK